MGSVPWQSRVPASGPAPSAVSAASAPRRLDPAHPFPYLPSGSLNIAVELRDPGDKAHEFLGMAAIVNIPASLPKWIEVPPHYGATCAVLHLSCVPCQPVCACAW
jgi:polyphosphate kinase